MPMSINNPEIHTNWKKQLLLVVAFLILVLPSAKFSIELGKVDFTLQTLALGVAYTQLRRGYGLLLVLLYIGIGIAGLDVFSGGQGWDYVSSDALGFFIGFVITSLHPKPTKKTGSIFLYFLLIQSIILIIGFYVMGKYNGFIQPWFQIAKPLLPGLVIKSIIGTYLVNILDKYLKLR